MEMGGLKEFYGVRKIRSTKEKNLEGNDLIFKAVDPNTLFLQSGLLHVHSSDPQGLCEGPGLCAGPRAGGFGWA